MIDAAERIVAERGLASMTLSEVQAAAGQRNKSAATYHFGSRDGLIAAIIEARMGPVNHRRTEMLEVLDSRTGVPSSRDLVEALVLPLAAETLGRPGSRYARFLTQAMFAPELAESIERHLRADSFRAVRRRLGERDRLPAPIAELRTSRIVTLMIVTLAMSEGDDLGLTKAGALVSDLIDTCVAVLDAPVSDKQTADRLQGD